MYLVAYNAAQVRDDFYRTIVDHFDQNYKDSAKSGREMALALHPFVIGQPFRHKYLAKALPYISRPRRCPVDH
jgi:allantoinase